MIVPATSLTISLPTLLLNPPLQPLRSPCPSLNIARLLPFQDLGTYFSSAGKFFSLVAYFCSSIFSNGALSKRYSPVPLQKKKKKKPPPIPSYSNPLDLALYFFSDSYYHLTLYTHIYVFYIMHTYKCKHIH